MEQWIDLIRSCIRPFISVTGWTAFLIIVVWVAFKFMTAGLANQLIVGFIGIVGTIVGVWLGSRGTKPLA